MQSTIQEATSIIKNIEKPLRVFLPLNPQGIINATLLTKTFTELNIKFALSFLSAVTEEQIKQLAKENYYGGSIFIDLPLEYLKPFEKNQKEKPTIIITTQTQEIPLTTIHSINITTTVYELCKELYPKIRSLSHLPLLYDTALEQEARSQLHIHEGLTIFNSATRPLHKTLEYSYDPYLPGITGNENAILNFLNEINIPLKKSDGTYRRIIDLTTEELKSLLTRIIITQLGSETKPEELYGKIYLLNNEEEESPLKSLLEYHNLLECSCVYDKPTLAISACLGNTAAKREAIQLLNNYTKDIISSLNWFVSNKDKIIENKGYVIVNTEEHINPSLLPTFTKLLKKTNIYQESAYILVLGHTFEEIQVILTSTEQKPIETLTKILKTITKKIGDYTINTNHESTWAYIQLEKEGEFLKNALETLDHNALEETVALKKPL